MKFELPSKKILIICTLIYLVHVTASQIILPSLNKIDYFPFFNWNLFSHTPDEQETALIFVKELNGQKFSQPKLTIQNRDLIPAFNIILCFHQIRRFSDALQRYGADHPITTLYRKEMELNLFYTHSSAVYEVMVTPLNYRKYLKDGTYGPTRSIGTFEFRRKAVSR